MKVALLWIRPSQRVSRVLPASAPSAIVRPLREWRAAGSIGGSDLFQDSDRHSKLSRVIA